MLSGPVLALGLDSTGELVIGRGPFLHHPRTHKSERLESIVHGIEENLWHGGRHVWTRTLEGNIFCVETRDWVMHACIFEKFLFVTLMHNRVDIYDLSCSGASSLIGSMDCPNHALLYSAHITAEATGDGRIGVKVIGGGVMCDMYFWSFVLGSDSCISCSVVRHHRGSIFRIRRFGKIVLTTSDDRSVCLWHGEAPVQQFKGHQARVWDAVLVGTNLVATACEDSLVRLFDIDTGALVETLSGHSKDVRALVFNREMNELFSGGEDGSVRRWSMGLEASRHVYKIESSRSENDWIRSIHLRSVGEDVVVVTNLGSIYIYGNSRLRSSIESRSVVTCATLISDKYVFLGTVDGSVIVTDIESESVVSVASSVVTTRAVSIFRYGERSAIVSNHCGEIAIINCDGSVDRQFHLSRSPSSNSPVGKLLCFASIPSSNIFVFGDDKGIIYTWTATRGCRSLLLSRSAKCISITHIGENSIGVNLSNGSSVPVTDIAAERLHFNVEGISRSSLCPFICETNVGFTSTDFVVVDSSSDCVQFRHKCGGHRRPFDYRIRDRNVSFVYGATAQSFCVVQSAFRCATVVHGCNGDLIHGIVAVSDSIMTANEDNKLRVIKIGGDGGQLELLQTLNRHEGSVRAISRVDDCILSGGARSQLVISRITHGALHCVASTFLPGDTDVRVMGVAGTRIGGDNYRFIAVTSSADIFRIDFSTSGNRLEFSRCESSIPEMQKSVCLSVAATIGGEFIVGAGNGYICHIDRDGNLQRSARVHQSGVNAIVSCFDGKYIISVGDDQAMVVCDSSLSIVYKVVNASSCSIRAVVADNERIFATGTDRLLTEWNLSESTGHLALVKRSKLAVTDPLSLAVLDDSRIVVGGRGIEVISTAQT